MNPNVDLFIDSSKKWAVEFTKLRHIILNCLLVEELKWGVPCYTFQQANILLYHGFKEYCALTFFKGALLQDEKSLLHKLGKHTQAGRQLRFKNISEIVELEAMIKAYIVEALEVEKAGLKVEVKSHTDYTVPSEFQIQLDANEVLHQSFYALTPGRQRAYLLFFSDAKQSPTRIARIEKYKERIINGKGIMDCVCGLSKRMPTCDGSHK